MIIILNYKIKYSMCNTKKCVYCLLLHVAVIFISMSMQTLKIINYLNEIPNKGNFVNEIEKNKRI